MPGRNVGWAQILSLITFLYIVYLHGSINSVNLFLMKKVAFCGHTRSVKHASDFVNFCLIFFEYY